MKLLYLFVATISCFAAADSWTDSAHVGASLPAPVALSGEAHDLTWDFGLLYGDDRSAAASWTTMPSAAVDNFIPVDTVREDPTPIRAQCESLRDDLMNHANITHHFSPFFRLSYQSLEFPFGSTYTGMAGLRNFGRSLFSHAKFSQGKVDVYAVDEGVQLCVLKTTVSGTWTRSGKEFKDVDHYIEIKAYDGVFVGARIFDGMQGKQWITSYRTAAQQRAYDLAADIFRSGYKSRVARRHLSHELALMLHPLGFSRYGPQLYRGKKAVMEAVDFLEMVQHDNGGWRRGWKKDEDDDEVSESYNTWENDEDEKPDGRVPFPLPIPYTGHWCDTQFTNDTVIAGFCILGHGVEFDHAHHSHHHHHHHGHGMSLFSAEDSNIPPPSGPTSRERMIGELYVSGYMTYYRMRLDKEGKIEKIFIMPLQPNSPGYHGFRTHSADTRSSGSTDDVPTVSVPSSASNAVIGNSGRNPETALTIMSTRILSAWLGEDPVTGKPTITGDYMDFVSVLMAQGEEAAERSFSSIKPIAGEIKWKEDQDSDVHDIEINHDKFDTFFGLMA